MPKKEKTSMEKLTAGYEKFIKGKKLNKDGKQSFEEVIKKTVTKQQQPDSK
ncbi:MAG: hypothetical protein JWN78_1491 [Bacteroidota bacterium]|nr:hypothetical protein [Bacteroidota bacterium]